MNFESVILDSFGKAFGNTGWVEIVEEIGSCGWPQYPLQRGGQQMAVLDSDSVQLRMA